MEDCGFHLILPLFLLLDERVVLLLQKVLYALRPVCRHPALQEKHVFRLRDGPEEGVLCSPRPVVIRGNAEVLPPVRIGGDELFLLLDLLLLTLDIGLDLFLFLCGDAVHADSGVRKTRCPEGILDVIPVFLQTDNEHVVLARCASRKEVYRYRCRFLQPRAGRRIDRILCDIALYRSDQERGLFRAAAVHGDGQFHPWLQGGDPVFLLLDRSPALCNRLLSSLNRLARCHKLFLVLYHLVELCFVDLLSLRKQSHSLSGTLCIPIKQADCLIKGIRIPEKLLTLFFRVHLLEVRIVQPLRGNLHAAQGLQLFQYGFAVLLVCADAEFLHLYNSHKIPPFCRAILGEKKRNHAVHGGTFLQ